MRVTAAVMEEKAGKFNLESLELDAPRSDEVLVQITATGVCHTDLHARDGYFAMPYPAVYGHEGAGVVAAIGSAVEHLAVGDHVVLSFPWCGECEHCREDRRSYCQRGRELKSGGARGRVDDDEAQWGAGLWLVFSAILVRHPCADAGPQCGESAR